MTTITQARTTAKSAPRQRRAAGVLLFAGPAIFLMAEFITAAAWADPGYSYTYDFISNLGVQGPSTLFGQHMQSPLYWLMNTGFCVFGIVILAGAASLRGATGWRRLGLLVPAMAVAAGGVLVGLFPGSAEAMHDGSGSYHALGAFALFLGGNILAIVLGSMRERFHLTRTAGRALVAVGIIGLASMIGYLAVLVLASDGSIAIIGLIERGATHPFLIALLCTGVSIIRRRQGPSEVAVD